MKKLTKHFVFALAGLLSTTGWAALDDMVSLTTIAKGDYPTTIAKGDDTTMNYAGLSYDDGTAVLKNEAMGLLLVYPVSTSVNLSSYSPTELFAIDRAGQVVLKEVKVDDKDVIAGVTWAVCTVTDNNEEEHTSNFFSAKDDTTFIHPYYAINSVSISGTFTNIFHISSPYRGHSYEFTMSDISSLYSGVYPYMFLVTFDRRTSNESTLEVGTTRVAKWGVLSLGQYNPFASIGGKTRYLVLNDESLTLTNTNGDLNVYTPVTYPKPTTPTELPTSLVVTNADSTETLTGVDLTEYLTPAMVATTPIKDGFALSCNSSDVLTYTLQTKASLSEEWVNFDTIAENLLADINENLDNDSKKTLANNFEKRYTCLRVKESTQIKIPQSPKETQRFYRLIVE